MTSPFQPVVWNGQDYATQDKLNQMTNNEQWLFENLPKVRYSAPGITREITTKILAVRIPYGATAARQVRLPLYFNGYFSSACSPICVGSGVSQSNKRLQVTFSGLSNATLFPSSVGCMVQVEADEIYPQAGAPLGGSLYQAGAADVICVGF